jgi:hypothetical protein
MTSFETSVCSAIENSFKSIIKNYISEFAVVLTDKINTNKNLTNEEVVELWNNIANDLVIKSGSRKKSSGDELKEGGCNHIFTKGDREGKICNDKISKNSSSEKFCSRHYKQNEKEDEKNNGDEKDNDIITCCYELKKGNNIGKECGKKVTKGSTFCSKHKDSEKAVVKGDKKDNKKKGDKGVVKDNKKKGDKGVVKDNKKKEAKKDEEFKLNAKKIKTGNFKDMCYFEKNKIKYIFENTSKIVKGTMNSKGELEKLTGDQIIMIQDMAPFKVEDDVKDKDDDVKDDDVEEEDVKEEDVKEEEEEEEDDDDVKEEEDDVKEEEEDDDVKEEEEEEEEDDDDDDE